MGVDDSASAWKLLGYRFDDRWALEGGSTDLGRYAFGGQVSTDPGTVSATWKAHDWNLLVLAGLLAFGGVARRGWSRRCAVA